MKLILSVLSLTFLLNTSVHAKLLSCENQDFYDGHFMWAKVSLSGILTKTEDGYNLSHVKFDYILSMHSDFEYAWAEGNYYDPTYSINNYAKYNPRVYFGHVKFKDLYARRVFGEVDFIVPEDKLNTTENHTSFNAYTIMTAMDDHWGGTVTLNCTLSTSDQL
jgi:hypothetical protein